MNFLNLGDFENWYILKVRPESQFEVRDQILELIDAAQTEGLFDAFVPTEVVGGRIPARIPLYPGYIMVQCHYSEELAKTLLDLPDVLHFALATRKSDGSYAKPKPMAPEDVKRISDDS